MNKLANAVRSVFHYDHTEDRTIIERVQDVEPILERAKGLHNAGLTHSDDREYVHAASIPNVIVERYCHLHKIAFDEFMRNEDHQRRLLNDPDLSGFRIWKGRV